MTTIAITADQRITINGRDEYNARIETIEATAAGKWEGTSHNGYSFKLVGGKAAGGNKGDWAVQTDIISDEMIAFSSAAEAIRFINSI